MYPSKTYYQVYLIIQYPVIYKLIFTGIKEIASGSAENYVGATVDMVNDKEKFLSKITNCMTDRSNTELKANRLIYEMKNENIDDELALDLNQFQCSIHILFQFYEIAEKMSRNIE